MAAMSVDDFKNSVMVEADAASRKRTSEQERYYSDRRLKLETSREGVGFLFSVARLASHFDDFPGFVSLERESNGHNHGLGLRRGQDGVWSLTADESFLRSSHSIGGGYLGAQSIVTYAMKALGIPHSPEAYDRVAALCTWGPDFGNQVVEVASALPRHVIYSALGHGSDFARFIGADKGSDIPTPDGRRSHPSRYRP